MLFKVGQLLVDCDLVPKKESSGYNFDDMEKIYTFGIIVAADPVDLEDHYFLMNRDNFIDDTTYTIMWADYDELVDKYSAGHIKQFVDDLKEIEKEMDEKSRLKKSKPKKQRKKHIS